MVAITVILAAVIGTFVLGLGSQLSSNGPTASIGVSDGSGNFDQSVSESSSTAGDFDPSTVQDAYVLTHDSGGDIKMEDLKIVVRESDGAKVVEFSGDSAWQKDIDGTTSPFSYDIEVNINGQLPSAASAPSSFSTGDTIVIKEYAANSFDTASAGDNTHTFSNFPDGEYKVQLIHTASGNQITEQTVEVN